MYFDDHAPPHFHALHGGDMALVEIATGEVIRGTLRSAERRRVKRWTALHTAELMANWTLSQTGGSVVLARIPGLDKDDA